MLFLKVKFNFKLQTNHIYDMYMGYTVGLLE
jgi:hypothetical protein